jgi:hypothetical protein
VEFEQAAAELYALPPEEFVDSRERLAKQARSAGDRELAARIHGLRRPTLAAWAVNLLVREQPQTCDELLSLGAGLRQAWAAADGTQLQELSARRREVVYALAQLVRRLAYQHGHPLSEDAADEVQATLDAALADPAVAREACSGRLEKARSYAGFGPAEWQPGSRPDGAADSGTSAGAPAKTAAKTAGKAAEKAGRSKAAGKRAGGAAAGAGAAKRAADKAADRAAVERAAAEERAAEERRLAEEREARRRAERERLAADARDAARAAEAAEADLAEVEEQIARAERRRDEATAEIERLTGELENARIELAEARRAARDAGRDRTRLAQRAASARRRADQARAQLAAADE